MVEMRPAISWGEVSATCGEERSSTRGVIESKGSPNRGERDEQDDSLDGDTIIDLILYLIPP